MNVADRLQRLYEALDHLRVVCDGAVVVVEGRKDVAALEALRIGGTVRTVNERGTVEDLIVSVAQSGGPVVILVDWDRTGGRLARRLHDGLVGQVTVDMDARRRLAAACHCKCVEHVPAELRGLEAKVGMRR